MATESVATTTRPADVGLKREMGLIGATWASETSIIGSGWLFGALFAAAGGRAGRAAGLGHRRSRGHLPGPVHAELGGMYPVSGGTARFPHFAFGSVAGISFGFFSWVQAVTVAPIECFAVMQYGSYYWHGLFDATTNGGKGNVTGLGFVMTIVLMAIFTAVNFLAMRLFSQGQRRHHLVEGRHPGPRHHRAAVQVPRRQLQRGRRLHALRDQGPVRGDPVGGHRVRLPRLRAGRPAGRARSRTRSRTCRGRSCSPPHRHRDLRPAAGRVHRRDAAQPARPRVRRDQRPPTSSPGRSPAWRAWSGSAWLATHPADRRVHLAVRHRPDLPDLDLAGRLRAGQEPVLPAGLRQGRQATACRGSA